MVQNSQYTDQTTLGKVIDLIDQLEKDLWDRLGDLDSSYTLAKETNASDKTTLETMMEGLRNENTVLDGEIDGLEG